MFLFQIDWTSGPSTAEVVVPVPTGHISASQFPGLYTAGLPKRCWASDSKRLLLNSIWRSTQHILLVNTSSRVPVVSLTQGMISELPKWEILDVNEDVIVASASAPNLCPRIYVAKIPAEGEESSIEWILLDEGAGADKNLEKEIQFLEWGIEAIKIPVLFFFEIRLLELIQEDGKKI